MQWYLPGYFCLTRQCSICWHVGKLLSKTAHTSSKVAGHSAWKIVESACVCVLVGACPCISVTCICMNVFMHNIIGGSLTLTPYLDVVNGSRVFPYVSTYVSNDYAYIMELTHTSFLCMHMRTRYCRSKLHVRGCDRDVLYKSTAS